MTARARGLRRITLVSRGLAVAGVAGSLAFAGLARADTHLVGTPPTTPTPTTPTPTPTVAKTTTKPPVRTPPRHQAPQVTETDQEPQVTTGGS